MKNNAKISFGSFSGVLVQDEENQVAAMIAKLRTDKFFTNLPSWMDEVNTDGVKPSLLPAQECFMRLMESKSKNIVKQHPVYALETLSLKDTIAVTPVKVTKLSTDGEAVEVFEVKKSLVLSSNPEEQVFSMMAAVTSTLVSVELRVTSAGVSPVSWPKANNMENIDLTAIRTTCKCDDTSYTEGRAKMYDSLMMSKTGNAGAHTEIGSVLKNYKVDGRLSTEITSVAVRDKEIKKGEKLEVKLVEMDKSDLKSTLVLDSAYHNFMENQVCRGGPSSAKGALTSGYFMFEMTRSYANKFRVVKDIMNIMKLNGSNHLLTSTMSLAREEIRWLINNKIYIIAANENFPDYNKDKVGVYSWCPEDTHCVTYIKLDTHEMMPQIIEKKVIYPNPDKMKGAIGILSRAGGPVFSYLPLTPVLSESSLGLYPSVDPSNMHVIVTNKMEVNIKFSDHVRRCSSAVICRSRFPRSRAPFWIFDKMGEFCDWTFPVIIPRLTNVKGELLDVMKDFKQEVEVIIDLSDMQCKDFMAKMTDKIVMEIPSYQKYFTELDYEEVDYDELKNNIKFMKDLDYDEDTVDDEFYNVCNKMDWETFLIRVKKWNPNLGNYMQDTSDEIDRVERENEKIAKEEDEQEDEQDAANEPEEQEKPLISAGIESDFS